MTEREMREAFYEHITRYLENVPPRTDAMVAAVIAHNRSEWQMWWAASGARDAEVEALRKNVVPYGYKLVPLEPSVEMLQAGRDTPLAGESDDDALDDYRAVYRAMLAAAPAIAQALQSG